MIKFNYIEIEGFKSISKLTYQLDRPGVNIISGPNGVGKTTILDALVWVIKGKTLKRINDPEPWDSAKGKDYRGTRVKLNFSINNKTIEIYRHRKFTGKTLGERGNNSIIVTGENKIRDKRDRQKYIDQLIPFSFDLLKNSIIFGQRLKRLLEQDGPAKKKVFDEAFEMGYLDRAREIAHKKLEYFVNRGLPLGNERNDLQEKIRSAKALLSLENKHKSDFLYNRSMQITNLYEELKEVDNTQGDEQLDNKIKKAIKELKELRESMPKEPHKKIVTYKLQLSGLRGSIRDTQDLIIKEKRKLLDKAKVCPTCGREIKFREKKKITLAKVKELKEKLGSLEKEMATLSEKYYQQVKREKKYVGVKLDIQGAERRLKILEGKKIEQDTVLKNKEQQKSKIRNKIKELEQSEYKSKIDRPKLKVQLTKQKKRVQELEGLIVKNNKMIGVYKWVLGEPLSNSGIKAYVFDQMIEKVNHELALYSKTFDFQVKIGVNMESKHKDFFAVIIKDGKVRDYNSLSGGEMQLADVFIAFAIHDVTTVEKDINILCLDEVFEALDSDNINRVAELIRYKAKNKSIHLITHKGDFVLPSAHYSHIIKIKGKTSM